MEKYKEGSPQQIKYEIDQYLTGKQFYFYAAFMFRVI